MSHMRIKDLPKQWQSKIVKKRPLTHEVNTWCWVWTGTTVRGYAQAHWQGHTWVLHLVTVQLAGLPRPEGLVSDHLCNRTSCINPYHIEFVTQQENVLRGFRRGRKPSGVAAIEAAKTHCVNGHEFTPENTLPNAGGKGRRCRTCKLEQEKLRKRMLRTGSADEPQPLTHCKRGHPLEGDNVRLDAQGRRVCKACMRWHQQQHRMRRS